jgi:hypothetical protein
MTVSKPKPESLHRKERACLGPNCMGEKTFLSDHSGHRLCRNCADAVKRIARASSDSEA